MPTQTVRLLRQPVATTRTGPPEGDYPNPAPEAVTEGAHSIVSDVSTRVRQAARRAATRARWTAAGRRRGDKIRTNTPRSPRFHGRAGTCVAVNDAGTVEIGVNLTGGDRVDAWFAPHELVSQ